MNASGLIEYDLKRAFEWLIQRPRKNTENSLEGVLATTPRPPTHKSRRLAAVLLLREFSYSVPLIMLSYLPRFFSHIWVSR